MKPLLNTNAILINCGFLKCHCPQQLRHSLTLAAAHFAAALEKTDSLSLLCRRMANPSAQSLDGTTPAHIIARGHYRSVDCMDVLLNWGADFGIKNVDGKTPTHIDVEKMNIECLYFLFEHCKKNIFVEDCEHKIPQDYVANCKPKPVCRKVYAALNGHDYPLPK